MCGIAAISTIKSNPDIEITAKLMAQKQHHRGPDHKGVYLSDDSKIALSHARLSIVDLSKQGDQPMTNEDKTLWLVCNGEIYNYKYIRNRLIQKGHKFYSNSDSEVILHLYEERGTDLLEELNGMFAFVLYDSIKKTLFCARDRLGEKPLVYTTTSYGTAIASEIPALMSYPGIDTSIDPTALGIYLLRNVRNIPDPWTLYKGIRRLLAGHAMIIKDGQIGKIWRYWYPSFRKSNHSISDLRDLFDSTVASRCVADVEVGALLSGGVDSSGIVQAMVSQGYKGVRTYAMGLNPEDEELARARRMANFLGTEHKEFYFNPEQQHEHFEHLLKLYGEPIMLLPLLHTYELCQHIKSDGLKVVMNGNGADELFYGYNGHNRLALISSVLPYLPKRLGPYLKYLASKMQYGSKLRELLLVAGSVKGERKRSLYQDEASNIWGKIFNLHDHDSIMQESIEQWLGIWVEEDNSEAYIDEANIIGLMHENCHSVTIPGDLAAMAASIEARAPFLNHELVEMAWQINYKQKIKSISNKSYNKWILKQAFEGRVPKDLLYAPKRGFGYNISEEELLRGPWKHRVNETFSNMSSFGGVLNLDYIRELKYNFDHNKGVSAMLIAKLYAVFQFNIKE